MDMVSRRSRLQKAPLDFLSAVSSPSTLHVFNQEWRSLNEDVQKASQMSLLQDEDISLVHSTATLVAVWSELLLKIDEETTETTTHFVQDVEDIFSRLTMNDIDRIPSPLTLRRDRSLFSAPPYMPAAYSWIVHNIHNPYPSTEVKQRISRDAGRPLRIITDWFKDVRRHIGWVALCKNHFQGSRALAVQAAKNMYLHADSSQLSLSSDVVSQFEAIRTRLCGMYPMADDNDDLSDGTDDSFTPSSLSFDGYPSNQSPYARSRSSSSTPSLVYTTDDEDDHSLAPSCLDDAPASLGKRKNLTEEDELRPLKRNRSGFIVADGLVKDITVSPIASATLRSASIPEPSPSSTHFAPSRKRRLSIAASGWDDASATPSILPSECDARPPLRVPKRRLSVSDLQPASKRPCLPPAVGPRKQAVSTPVPIVHQTTPAADDWFPFELSDTSSVELFNWDGVVENDAFLYNSLFDNILQSDGQDSSSVTPPSDAYQSPTPLDLGVSSVLDPSVLDISSAFTEPPPTHLTAPISTPPGPITATTTPVFDFLDAFLSAVNAESAEPHTTQSSSSPSTELSLNDTIDLFGESVVMP